MIYRILLFICLGFLFSQQAIHAQTEKLKIGMTHAEFNAVMDNLIPGKNNYNGYLKDYVLAGGAFFNMNGEIRNDTLVSIWASNEEEIDFLHDDEMIILQKLNDAISTTEKIASLLKLSYGNGGDEKNIMADFIIENDTYSDTLYSYHFNDGKKSIKLSLYFDGHNTKQSSNQIDNYQPVNANGHIENDKLRIFIEFKGIEEKENIFGLKCGTNAATVYNENNKLLPDGYLTDGTWYKKSKIYGVEDDWRFNFEKGKLISYSFESELYDSDEYEEKYTLTDKKFNAYQTSIKSSIDDYTKRLGKADTSEFYATNLKDIRAKAEAGLQSKFGSNEEKIAKAYWKKENTFIQISLNYTYRKSKDTMRTLEYKIEMGELAH